MPKSARDIPKEIAAFGERQFKETGASAVEVLRVKAAVMRKYFRQLRGITFLVAVIALDRVRIYFFSSTGAMLVGENVEPSIYQKLRTSSKLVAKFEKPKELTQEEQRIEATQELRDSLAKAIRRVTRFLSTASPKFPDIFVIRTSSMEQTQSFGLQITDDEEYLFEESALKTKWVDGLITRAAFLMHLSLNSSRSQIASTIGNGLALAILKEPARKSFLEFWLKQSLGSEWSEIVNHLITHADCYTHEGFVRLYSLLNQNKTQSSQSIDWSLPLRIIHDTTTVAIGTEEYHVISRFCQTLTKPQKLNSRKEKLRSIHLSPRTICDPTSLNIHLSISNGEPSHEDWATISFLEGRKKNTLRIGPGHDSLVTAIEYWLNLEDVYPSSGGLVSHGKSVLQRALAALGVSSIPSATYESVIKFSETELAANEKAVLGRLILGQLDVLSNTLVGSPQIVERLLRKGKIIFLPSFNHIGLEPDYLVRGEIDALRSVVRTSCLEGTIINTNAEAIGIVSAPSTWKSGLLNSATTEGLSVHPILTIDSNRHLLRTEDSFPKGKPVFWE
ncbi:MAG: hypothetical protein EAX87_11720 [Candidatus Thorarchaeota archaeon]|nr:hypothetical protein [Candidatus Thorarchaeota archaeon]